MILAGCASDASVRYSPGYEIINGPLVAEHFDSDRRTVSACGVDAAAAALFALSQIPAGPVRLSDALVRWKCEEFFNDPKGRVSFLHKKHNFK